MRLSRVVGGASLGILLAAGGAYAEELTDGRKLPTVNAAKTDVRVAQQARAKSLREADALIRNGKPAEAYALLEPLESGRSGEVRFDYLLGIAALDSGKPDKAVRALERVLAIDPDFTGARLDMARAYYQLGDLPRARSEFETVLKRNPPENVQATINKYLAAMDSGAQAKQSAPASVVAEAMADNGNSPLVRIERFNVEGNTLLDAEQIEQLLAPYRGERKSFTDIQRALEALEDAYRKAGYRTVSINTPEQEVTDGTITFIVTESVIGKVILDGNQHYDESNVRHALPALVEGEAPNAPRLSENIRLANQNPTRQVDVVLSLSDEEGKVDAKVNVKDESPHKFFVTLDNTGNQATGMYRTGIGYQHNNLFNSDQAATFNYITSPDHAGQVTQLSASYRWPLYVLGDSIDLIGVYSDTDAGTVSTVAGPLSFSGQGKVFSARYNHYRPRQGDYTSRITAGLDYRAYLNNCSLGAFGAAGCGAAAASVTVHPLSLGYDATLTRPTYVADYGITLVRNIPGGARGGAADFNAVRPSPVGGSGARADYTVLRLNGSLAGALPEGWQYRLAGSAQYTQDALISGESFGLVGSTAVRGFLEREYSRDKGYVLNLEIYTPELSSKFGLENGGLRLLGFADHAQGWRVPLAGELVEPLTFSSIGLGLRMAYQKNISAKFDLARVINAGGNSASGNVRGHFGVVVTW